VKPPLLDRRAIKGRSDPTLIVCLVGARDTRLIKLEMFSRSMTLDVPNGG